MGEKSYIFQISLEANLKAMFYISNIVISTIKYQCKARN